ncbi:hypothetical protein AWC38_SpisGene7804 [Stylophora pistillata]|uniref:Uncharacterized protein n=1 Tax=Stylophora pistillata TaxID=50429 RepID=A0A2B4SEK2_STYPI|nr:hypothetical protein AWC38_SpisGene7804 [Stylophora pistillata]
MIVREIDEIKEKLDALSRKDFEASISFFEKGIALLYEAFDIAKSRNESGAAATSDVAFSLNEGVRSKHGDYLKKFKLLRGDTSYKSITFHRAGEHVIVAGVRENKEEEKKLLQVEMYSKDGEFVRSALIQTDDINGFEVRGITMTTEGRIAVVVGGYVRDQDNGLKRDVTVGMGKNRDGKAGPKQQKSPKNITDAQGMIHRYFTHEYLNMAERNSCGEEDLTDEEEEKEELDLRVIQQYK